METSNQHLNAVVVGVQAYHVPNVKWRERLKDGLHMYFQSKAGGNNDVEYIRLLGGDADVFWYKVFFVERSGKFTIYFNLNLR